MSEVNRGVIEQWATALESGEFTQQHEGFLSIPEQGDCCLGVLCKLAVREGVIPEGRLVEEGDPHKPSRYVYGEGEASLTLPIKVERWAGLDGSDPLLSSPSGVKRRASSYNDKERLSFPKIARLIRYTFLEGESA